MFSSLFEAQISSPDQFQEKLHFVFMVHKAVITKTMIESVNVLKYICNLCSILCQRGIA